MPQSFCTDRRLSLWKSPQAMYSSVILTGTAAEKYLEGYRYGSEACRKGYLRCRDQSVAHQNTPDTPEA